jgi:hypothetical protein
MHGGRPVGESFDHCPPGWIRQSRKRCTQSIHNRMVVDYWGMSSVNFAIAKRWRLRDVLHFLTFYRRSLLQADLLQTILPISRSAFVMGYSHDAYGGFFIPVNDGKTETGKERIAGFHARRLASAVAIGLDFQAHRRSRRET